MAEIINLRLVRKAKARAAKEANATANRAAFGRKKVERQATQAEIDRRDHALSGAKRDDPAGDR